MGRVPLFPGGVYRAQRHALRRPRRWTEAAGARVRVRVARDGPARSGGGSRRRRWSGVAKPGEDVRAEDRNGHVRIHSGTGGLELRRHAAVFLRGDAPVRAEDAPRRPPQGERASPARTVPLERAPEGVHEQEAEGHTELVGQPRPRRVRPRRAGRRTGVASEGRDRLARGPVELRVALPAGGGDGGGVGPPRLLPRGRRRRVALLRRGDGPAGAPPPRGRRGARPPGTVPAETGTGTSAESKLDAGDVRLVQSACLEFLPPFGGCVVIASVIQRCHELWHTNVKRAPGSLVMNLVHEKSRVRMQTSPYRCKHSNRLDHEGTAILESDVYAFSSSDEDELDSEGGVDGSDEEYIGESAEGSGDESSDEYFALHEGFRN
ncbi:hypothetical protein THAOC_19716 [Thalassiosira oceanica]|uniref:Uncharacterized protein n=1 Tax=Thalassiosira oceanica TaxID=159749 RepID=K0S400_THAOC|nr:hypothetical protein THAOC_19716 [Thalassiosira oceanica]|eukprot:EJK60005.1 hypothetical protein THAOC_19716 [Thalassiosira oceanica]